MYSSGYPTQGVNKKGKWGLEQQQICYEANQPLHTKNNKIKQKQKET